MEIHRYEKIWMGISITAIIVMLIALILTSFGVGVSLPGAAGSVDPRDLINQPPFDKPGVYEVSPGKYRVVMIAFTWSFNPAEVRVPVNSEVTFEITSRDVTHGVLLEGTNLNIMVIPGQVAKTTVKFTKPGNYQYVCHEYCGVGHQAMAGKVIVVP